ncbi:beta-N-acetylhexosaminidase [Aquirufa nivalisilvae]|uniref:beta-N-acetylhexosaminidase n=1 Tax=Aquirufa nivalisilvae TaxID=2516557 RepID=UPI0022A9F460|nr:beta-N-acetylhexosaminidase [Aquirufa nivalisilvae]MCZ2479089.1 beta-N-acetylhexosaminidase [Aquirufa nivalisilvae]
MKSFFWGLCALILCFNLQAQESYQLIPKPAKLTPVPGKFLFQKNTVITLSTQDESFNAVATMLKDQISLSSGLNLAIKSSSASSKGVVFVQNASLGDEAYRLNISTKKIEIQAKSGKGAFYALQTLFQLMPAQIYSNVTSSYELTALACQIEDAPRFSYRGMMLDVGRYYFPVSFIKRFLDLMAVYKLNTFHWHLTEDQGWRIEIKKYPLLTSVSSVRKETMVGHYRDQKFDNKPYGGFYTQDEIKEVIAYASKKFITIIPEIEMPGHSQAVLAAYPELGCNPDKIYQVATKWGISEDVLCPREETFTFIENVLTEVMALFPGQYIHIGGDECPKKQWKESRFCQDLIKKLGLKDEHELQSYFIRRIDKFVTSKGKKLLGWDEILEGGLSPNAMVMSWRGTKGGIEAAKQNHDVVMSPNSFFYLDYYQADPKTQPLAIGGNLTLAKSYSFEPDLPELTVEEAKHIVGIQANVWTEYISTPAYAEYMTFPRALALSEISWSPKQPKDYDDFLRRVKGILPGMDALKINYCPVGLK